MAEMTNALKPPTYCDNCRSIKIELVTNDKIYGKIFGNWPYVYYCYDCKSSVGCHPNTNIPLGKMANKATRLLRRRAHISFDPLWQSGLMSRANAYKWLAEQLKIPIQVCHISWLSNKQLKDAISLSTEHFEENRRIAARRKDKRNAKFERMRRFEKSRIRIRKAKH